MEEIVKAIPLLLMALLIEPMIMMFILLPPVLFGFTFAFIEWASQSFSLFRLLDFFQIGLYTSATALVSEFVPLLLTGAVVVAIRRYFHLSSWQLGVAGVVFESLFALLHSLFSVGYNGDIATMVAIMSGVSVYLIDRHQKIKGQVPMPPQQLLITTDTSGDFASLKIKSDRLDLKSINSGYSEVVFKTFTPEVTHYMTTKAPMIPAETEQFIFHTLKRMKKGYEIVLVISETATGRFVGLCGIHARTDATKPEIGIWLREDAQAQGYGTEAIDALIDWGSRHLICDYFSYSVVSYHKASISVAKTNGGILSCKRTISDSNGSRLEMLVYKIPLRKPDPMIRHASIVLWSSKTIEAREVLYSPDYRLTKTKDIIPKNKPDTVLDAYEIHGRYILLNNQRIQQRPKSWVEAGKHIRSLIDQPEKPLIYCNKDAALALSMARISQSVDDLLSIELISAVALDPSEPTIINAQERIAPITKVASIPDNYYVIIFNINGRHKYIHHIRSNGELVFEDVHTMGNSTLKKSIPRPQAYVKDDTSTDAKA